MVERFNAVFKCDVRPVYHALYKRRSIFHSTHGCAHSGIKVLIAVDSKCHRYPFVFHSMCGADEREGNSPSWFNADEAQQVLLYVRVSAVRFLA